MKNSQEVGTLLLRLLLGFTFLMHGFDKFQRESVNLLLVFRQWDFRVSLDTL